MLGEICVALVALILTAVLPVHAQTIPAQSIYEGQIVDAVDLVASPDRDVDALRSLVIQKAGKPLSTAAVVASVAALEKQGGFSNVRVETILGSSGLVLNFIIEPPYYIGVMEFSHLPKRFSYAQLLAIVNFSDQQVYSKAHLPSAESALVHFFERNGFFQAQAHAVPRIDDKDRVVNVTFFINLGRRARVRTVEVHGLASDEKAKLVGALGSKRARFAGAQLKPGTLYSGELENAATTFVKKILARKHYLASKVQSQAAYDPARNVVDVSFDVDLGPIIGIQVSGARLSRIPFVSGRQAKKLIPAYSERTVDQDVLDQGERNLIDFFKRKGFFDVEVATQFRPSPRQMFIRYKIKTGQKHKVNGIFVNGPHQISEKELLAEVTVKKSRFLSPGRISDSLLLQSADNLKAVYNDRGYEQAKISPRIEDRENKIDVYFEVDAGSQTLVDNVVVKGNEAVPQERFTASNGLQLRPGMPFSARRLAEDRNRISAAYQNQGYLNVEVTSTVQRQERDAQHVNVTYIIAEGQMVRINQLAYLGQKQTRLSLLEKTTQIQLQTPMKRGDLLTAESRLYGLNIFDWSSVGPKRPIADQSEEGTLVKVHEDWRNEISYGFGFDVSHRGGSVPAGSVAVPGLPPLSLEGHKIAPSEATYAGPRGSIQFSRRNIRGLAETASGLALLSRLDQQFVLTYSQPQFVGSQWSSLASVSIERTTENPLYAAGLGNASFQVERLLNRKTNTRLQLRYKLNKTNLSDLLVPELVLPQDRNVRLSTFSGTLIRDTRDKLLDAHRGSFATLDLALTSTALGSSASFAKLFGQYAFYKSAGGVVFANSVRLGLAKAIAGSFVPTSELFFSGGGTSLRSFPINQAGPQRIVPFCNVLEGEPGCVDVTVPVGGRQLFILNSELRFPMKINKGLGGVLFYDGGNVYQAINFNDFLRNYTHTIGFGLRYATPIGPVRIDVGHNLTPVPGIKPTQYYITIGQAF